MSPKTPLPGLRPTHPGEILREITLPALGRTKVEIAGLLGVSRRALYNILDEKAAMSTDMAMRIAKLTGTSAQHWLNIQQLHDLKIAETELAADLRKIPRLEAAE